MNMMNSDQKKRYLKLSRQQRLKVLKFLFTIYKRGSNQKYNFGMLPGNNLNFEFDIPDFSNSYRELRLRFYYKGAWRYWSQIKEILKIS